MKARHGASENTRISFGYDLVDPGARSGRQVVQIYVGAAYVKIIAADQGIESVPEDIGRLRRE